MSRFLLVELEPDLAAHHTTHTAAVLSVQQVNGVRSATDMSALSRQTLEEWVGELFLPPNQLLVSKRRPKRNGTS